MRSPSTAPPRPCISPAWPPGLARATLWTSPNHLCGFGQLWAVLRRAGRLCRYRSADLQPERCRLEEKLAQAEEAGLCPRWWSRSILPASRARWTGLRALAETYGFTVIEDASHAIGGKYQGHPIGNCRFSDMTVFSFHPVKIITTGEGGMVLTNVATV